MTMKGKFIGKGTIPGIPAGLRRNEFQDRLLEWNEQPGRHHSDQRLAEMMDAEHSDGIRIADKPSIVQAIRREYNLGKHGIQQKPGVPRIESKRYG